MKERIRKIAEILPTRQKDAVSYKTLSAWTGLSKRQLREVIRRERREGNAILTSHEKGKSGVWLWDGYDKGEFDRCYEMLVNTGVDYLETARLMRERYRDER